VEVHHARSRRPPDRRRRRKESGLRGSGFDLVRLKQLAAADKFDELLGAATTAKAEAADPLQRAHAGLFLAQAYLRRLADPRAALTELHEALPVFEAEESQLLVVECMDWQSAALYLLEDRSALVLAEAALEACRRLSPANRALEARIIARLGSIHNSRGQAVRAIELYRQALEVAGEQRDLSRLGKMYTDLGVAYWSLGDLERARDYSQKAIAVHELLNDGLSVARAENNLGMVLMRQGLLELAREHILRSVDLCAQAGVEAVMTNVLLSLAELDMQSGDPNGAREHLEEALAMAERCDKMGAVGFAHQLLGRLSESEGDTAAADRDYGVALETFERLGNPIRLVNCLAEYAEVLEARGDTPAALKAMKRAVVAQQAS
jgi:tetratricopeptide (TPR) repeat protein